MCEGALEAADLALSSQALVIQKQDEYATMLKRDVEDLERALEREGAWYKQPSVVLPTGFILGILAAMMLGGR